nr:unnamed protein product [Leishmania braziliensis]
MKGVRAAGTQKANSKALSSSLCVCLFCLRKLTARPPAAFRRTSSTRQPFTDSPHPLPRFFFFASLVPPAHGPLLGAACSSMRDTHTHTHFCGNAESQTPLPPSLPPSSSSLFRMSELAEYSRLIQKFDTCRTAFMMCRGQEDVEPHTRDFHNAFQVAKAMAAVHQLLGPEWSVFVATGPYSSQDTRHADHDVQLPEDAIIAENVQTSMLVPEVQLYILGDAERGISPVQQVIIWGCETYGCVLQTSDELLAHGIRVAVLVDGCTSRIAEMHDTAILQMSHWDGLMVTTAPSAIMQLTRSDARFVKPIIQILKTFAADWSTTQPLPELSSQRVGGGDGDPATAVSDATAASPVSAVTTAGDAATKRNSAYSGKGY